MSLMLTLCGVLALDTFGAGADPLIDRSVALGIGRLEVSQYALDKSYRRFEGDFHNANKRDPGSPEVAQWFRQYLSRQIIAAEAISRGYDKRPEVQKTGNAMERYMLSQPFGPLYRCLSTETATPSGELEALYRQTSREVNLLAVKFPAGKRSRLLGSDWGAATTGGRLLRLSAMEELVGAEVYDGDSEWPFNVFGDYGAREDIMKAEAGSWIEGSCEDVSGGEQWVIFIRSVRIRPKPEYSTERENFQKTVEFVNELATVQRRRRKLLLQCHFAFVEGNGAALATRIASLPSRTIDLPDLTATPGKDPELAWYQAAAGEVRITETQWRDYYNGLYIRQLPTTSRQVRSSLEDMVVKDLDCREAYARGLDKTPQFEEDRRNFIYATALALYEKEEMGPGAALDGPRVESDLARTLQRRFRISDRVPYSKYGMSGKVAPWSE